MWKAKLLVVKKQSGNIVANVEFYDGEYSFVEVVTDKGMTVESLREYVNGKIEDLKNQDTTYGELESAVGEELVPIAITLTQDEIDKKEWGEKVSGYNRLKIYVDNGTLTSAETGLEDLANEIKASFKKEYID